MAKIERQFHERIKGGHMENEDWWNLVFDTDSKRLYVEHTWSHMNPWKTGDRGDSGARQIEVNEFLKTEGPGWEKLAAMIQEVLGNA